MTKKVALIGSAYRLPSTSKALLWGDLMDGRNLISEVASDRWTKTDFLHNRKSSPGSSYTFRAGSIGDISLFDSGFFGISPREAAQMDPQQRLLLELAWEAFEDGGIRPSAMRVSACGVYIGIASADYSYRIAEDLAVIDSSVATGNTASIAANRISYFFDLRGPSMALDTACSSSLVAFHQACQAIRTGEVTHALAGGVSLHLHPYGFITFSKASMLSPKGQCNVFDANGDGYVRSEGGGIFLLKDYDLACADGDRILAIVANTVVNTDGHKPGLTIPSAQAQSALLRHAYQSVGIAPDEISYIEAHGTGTVVGDPIETRAIGESLGRQRRPDSPLPIGSIKSNVGHLEAAAGVAGVAKALEIIKHRQIPATIGITELNPRIDFVGLNLRVVTATDTLEQEGRVVIGVNSFGFGGSNAHVILTSPNEIPAVCPSTFSDADHGRSDSHRWLPVIVSAASPQGLREGAAQLAQSLDEAHSIDLYDVAFELARRREWFDHRAVLFVPRASNCATVAQSLRAIGAGEVRDEVAGPLPGLREFCPAICGSAIDQASGPAFIYAGNGAQWIGMGGGLLGQPVFASAIDAIDDIFCELAGYRIREHLSGLQDVVGYEHTHHAQPALFAVQVGMTQLLRSWGVRPAAAAGHSVGEVAAAWAAGALTLADAVKVIFHRSRLQETTKGLGKMTAVASDAPQVQTLVQASGMAGRIHIAGYNSARGLTLAGESKDLVLFESVLQRERIGYKRLPLDYAFHSPAMDGIESEVRAALSDLQPRKTSVPFYSGVTGEHIDGSLLDAEYWWHNIRWPVRFSDAVTSVIADGSNVLMEISPHPILKSYLSDALEVSQRGGIALSTLTRNRDTGQDLIDSVGELLVALGNAGDTQQPARPESDKNACGVDLSVFFPKVGARVDLPHYPWQRERHWLEHTAESPGTLDRVQVHPLLGARLPHLDWTWERRIDPTRVPFLADHVIGNAVVMPGSAYLEIALAASRAWQAGSTDQVDGLEIIAPMTFGSQQEKVLRVELDPADGRLTIKSRDVLSEDPWTVNARCRIIIEAIFAQIDASDRSGGHAMPAGAMAFSGADHLLRTQQVGLQYGPAFQAIDAGWSTDTQAEVTFCIPPALSTDVDQYLVHPALLDCAFQLIIEMLRERVELDHGIAFVPTQVGRASFKAGSAWPHSARARLLGWRPHSLLVSFVLFDAEGSPVLEIHQARFKRVRLQHRAGRTVSHLHTRMVPLPLHPERSESVVDYKHLLRMVNDQAHRNSRDYTYRAYVDELDPLLDALCARFGFEALVQPGSYSGASTAAVAAMPTDPRLAIYYRYLLTQASTDGFVDTKADPPVLAPPDDQTDQFRAIDLWNTLISDYPDHAAIIRTVGRIGCQLPALISGLVTLDDVLRELPSPAGSIAMIRGSSGNSRILAAVLASIDDAHARMKPHERLGILEVSALGPAIAAELAAYLDADRDDLVIATNRMSGLGAAEDLARKHSWVGIDLVEDPSSTTQSDPHDVLDGLGPLNLVSAGFRSDFALVHLDFSTDRANYRALDYALRLLKPGASLLVIGHHPTRWIDFSFGLQTACWEDELQDVEEIQQRSRLAWQHRMAGLGLQAVRHMDASHEAEAGAFLLIGKNPSNSKVDSPITPNETPRSWLILGDIDARPAHLVDQLARTLQQFGGIATICTKSDETSIAREITEMTAQFGELDGIIHLQGFGHEDTSSASSRCLVAQQIARACEAIGCAAPIWIVTSGVHLQCASEPMDRLSPDHILAGFTRSLINEHTANVIRLIDLDAVGCGHALLRSLVEELLSGSAETEVALTSDHGRFVPRIGPLVPAASADRTPHAGRTATTTESEEISTATLPNLTLGFTQPGQLRNLAWQPVPRRQLGPDEVEVAVDATGLNFRDVMYTLGLLSDEAIENGFAGPTLGLEFAGKVSRVGAAVSHLSVGDRAVGFGPGCFASWVVTKGSAASYIPRNLSYEAAATIPSTFLTSYYALCHLANLDAGERVLIHGAAGGVGLAAIQIAKWRRAEIFATAGSPEKRQFLKMLGVDHVLDSRTLRFADDVMTLTQGQGVDVVLNSLAGEAINRNFSVLRPFGRFLELGKRDFYENTRIGLKPFRNNISYFGVDADQLMNDRPDLTRRLFSEVIALFEQGILHALPYTSFEARDVEDAFRFMQQSQQIGKIVVTYRNALPAASQGEPSDAANRKLTLTSDGSYVVSGGLGGFGLRTAQWLVNNGARHLILLGRSGVSTDEARSGIAEMQLLGSKVTALACDVTDIDQLRRCLAPWRESIRGIVHAAAVIEDSLVRNLTPESLTRVIAPKVVGAGNLHEISNGLELDFFVLYSSATTLFGNPGQSAYVAANSWLEGLARWRRANGLPATCMLWGAIEDAGFLARHTQIRESLQQRMGGKALPADVALEALGTALVEGQAAEVAVLEFDWQALARFLPSSGAPRFSDLARDFSGTSAIDQVDDFADIAKQLDDAQLMERLVDMIRSELGQILRIAPEKLHAGKSVYDMGLDSLMAVELVVALEARLSVRLPVMALSESPTIDKLADKMKSILRTGATEDGEATHAQVLELARQHDADSTPEEIDALVRSMDQLPHLSNQSILSP